MYSLLFKVYPVNLTPADIDFQMKPVDKDE